MENQCDYVRLRGSPSYSEKLSWAIGNDRPLGRLRRRWEDNKKKEFTNFIGTKQPSTCLLLISSSSRLTDFDLPVQSSLLLLV